MKEAQPFRVITRVILCSLLVSFTAIAQQTINSSITHDNIQRTYILYVPASYVAGSPIPLMLSYHGLGQTNNDYMNQGDFRSIADTAGFILAYPQGTIFNDNTHWNVGGFTAGSTTDDIGFSEALIDSISAEYSIDSLRVYSTGFSNGGYLSFLLACQIGEKIAAIASVGGSMTPETYNNCSPEHPTPVLQIHGTTDNVVPYNGANWSRSIVDALQYWVGHNNNTATPVTTPIADIDPSDGSTVEHIVYDGGDNGVNTEHFEVTGGGHQWPGSAVNNQAGNLNRDIDASAEIWTFLSRYDINGLITVSGINDPTDAFPASFQLSQNYPNPFNPATTIEFRISSSSHVRLTIFNIAGEKVASLVDQSLSAGSHTAVWDAGQTTAGVYLYRLEVDGSSLSKKLVLLK